MPFSPRLRVSAVNYSGEIRNIPAPCTGYAIENELVTAPKSFWFHRSRTLHGDLNPNSEKSIFAASARSGVSFERVLILAARDIRHPRVDAVAGEELMVPRAVLVHAQHFIVREQRKGEVVELGEVRADHQR